MTSPFSSSPRFEDRAPPADLDHDFAHLNVGSRPVSLRTNSSSHSWSPNKDYLLYKFKRTGDGWYGANRAQVPVAQDDLKKLAGKGARSTSEQLRRMGPERREEIQALISELDALELEGAHWEPVYLETTASKITENKTKRVSAFDLVIHRRNQSVDKPKVEPKRRQSSTGVRPVKITSAQDRPKPQIHMASPAPAPAAAPKLQREDIFGEIRYFSPQGMPLDRNGTVPFQRGGKHADMQFERPINSIAPHQIENHEKKAKEDKNKKPPPGIVDGIDVEAVLGGRGPHHDDGGDVEEVLIVDGGPGEAARATKANLRRPSHSRHRHVNYETREPAQYSNRSSWASSDQASVYFGELDDRSSMTSNETHGSADRRASKYYRGPSSGVPRASSSRSPGGHRQYPFDEPVYTVPERRRRRPSSHDSGRRVGLGVEQPTRVHHHSPLATTPIIHQRPRETRREERIPPVVPEVLAFRDQARISEHRIDDYIHAGRARDNEPLYSPRATRPSFVDVGQQSRSRYNFEPRHQYR